jgi:hypothetical protein
VQENDELVTAHPGDRVRVADDGRQSVGDGAQDGVTDW